jgi:hypothetical protein
MNKEEEYHKHPSFGQIYFGRVNTTGADFYGSELTQDHYIIMEVSPSEIKRELSRDWYYARNTPLIKVRMSSAQFAECITSLNQGSGTPCTIEYVDGKKVADYPGQESRKEFVHRKFEDRMKMFADEIREKQIKAKQLVKKKTLSKVEMHELQLLLDWLITETQSNIPFFAKCFQETMDEVVFEAKQEVENAIQHKITTLGLNSLHEQNKLLESSK